MRPLTGKFPNRQRGAALLVIVMLLIISGSTVILAAANYQNPRQAEAVDILHEMAYAKDALIAYAIQHESNYSSTGAGPGHFPCPDTDNDGAAETSCNSSPDQYMGRLPEYVTLPSGSRFNINDTYADIDQQFWYAVSPAFHMSGTGAGVNTGTGTLLSVDGDTDVVAVIIAPGEAVTGQSRVSNDVGDYLEDNNQNGGAFIRNNSADPENFNDQILTISRNEIITAAANKAAREVKQSLDSFYDASSNYWWVIPYWGIGCGDLILAYNSYPRDNSNSGSCIIVTEQDAYDNALSSYAPAWYGNENWDNVDSYTYVSAKEATLTFSGCNIVYTLNYDNGISRDRKYCDD